MEFYISALASFGDVTSPPLADASAFKIFSWLKSNFAKLLDFVGKVGDIAALSSATNLTKTLAKAGCGRIKDLKRKAKFESPLEFGDPSKTISKAVKNYISRFLCEFGRQDAHALAEAHRAEVCFSWSSYCRRLVLSFFFF